MLAELQTNKQKKKKKKKKTKKKKTKQKKKKQPLLIWAYSIYLGMASRIFWVIATNFILDWLFDASAYGTLFFFFFFFFFCLLGLTSFQKKQNVQESIQQLNLLLLNTTCPVLANSVDPDQLASEGANWSGSALFVIRYVNFYKKKQKKNKQKKKKKKNRSSNLIGWKLEVGMES